MHTFIATINKTKYAFGSLWYALSSVQSARQEATTYAKEMAGKSSAWFAVSKGNSGTDDDMVSLVTEKQANGAYAALACFAKNKEVDTKNSLLVLDLSPNVFYVGALTNGMPEVGLDVIGDYDDVKKLALTFIDNYGNETGLYGNGRLFHELENGTSLSTIKPFATSQLADAFLEKDLRYTKTGNAWMLPLQILIATALIAGIGYQYGWKPYQAKKQLAMQQAAASAEIKEKTPEELYKEQLEQALATIAVDAPATFIATWASYLGNLKIDEGTWSLTDAKCTVSECTANYHREKGGTFKSLDEAIKAKGWNIISLAINRDTATISQAITPAHEKPAMLENYPASGISLHDFMVGDVSKFQRLSEIEGIKIAPTEPQPLIGNVPEGKLNIFSGAIAVDTNLTKLRAFGSMPRNVTFSTVEIVVPKLDTVIAEVPTIKTKLQGKYYVNNNAL